jgi:serine/threonine protein kinase
MMIIEHRRLRSSFGTRRVMDPLSPASSISADPTMPLGNPADAVQSTDFEVVSDEPQSFGDYDLLEEIGAGGMGRVYKARHRGTGRIVALKTLLPKYLSTPGLVARFRQEANAAAQLDHPRIVPVHYFGEADGQYFFTMALVEGQGLDKRLRQGPLDNRRAARIVEQAADAVAYAHCRGVIHRDIKPGNILIDDRDHVKVTDFGLARRWRETDSAMIENPPARDRLGTSTGLDELTRAGAIVGTPGFMSPEQARGDSQVGPAADVWALGAVLYACLTGRAPFLGADPLETLTLTLEADPVPPDEINPDADPDLVDICLRCLAKDPRDRFPNALELARALQRWREGHPLPRGWQSKRSPWTRFLENAPEVLPLTTALLVQRLTNMQEAFFVGGVTAGIQWVARRREPSGLGASLIGLTLCLISVPISGLLCGEGVLAGALISVVSMTGLMLAVVSGIPDLTNRWGGWSPQSWAVAGFLGGLGSILLSIVLALWLRFANTNAAWDQWGGSIEWVLGIVGGWAFAASLGLAVGAILGQWNRRLEVFGSEPFPAFLLSASLMAVMAAAILHLIRDYEPIQAAYFTAAGSGPTLAVTERMLTAWFGDSDEARLGAAAGTFCIKFLFFAIPMAIGAVIGSLVARFSGGTT